MRRLAAFCCVIASVAAIGAQARPRRPAPAPPAKALEEKMAAPHVCPVQQQALVDALRRSVKASGGPSNGGLDNNEWAVAVDRGGVVCAVAYSGGSWTDQWLGSRDIAGAKAITALSYSLDGKAMSTANLYAPAQPGGFLYGIAFGNPPVTTEPPAPFVATYGASGDPMLGKKAGGVIVFGGGLPLYDGRALIGGLGLSGDTSCADHNVAWRMRQELALDQVQSGVAPGSKDGILYDISNGVSASGFGHPTCGGNEAAVARDIGAGKGGGVLP